MVGSWHVRKTSRHHTGPGHAWRALGAAVLVVLGAAGTALAQASGEPQELPKPHLKKTPPLFKEWTFGQDRVGASPAGFTSLVVGGKQAGTWEVREEAAAPSRPTVLVQQPGCQTAECYQLLLADGTNVEYLDLSVRLKMLLGAPAGKGGLVFGGKDRHNFYAVVVAPETNRLEAYVVKDGAFHALGQEPVVPTKGEWHFLRVSRSTMISHDLIEVYFDNQLILSASDSSLQGGQIGLITLGPTAFAFDNLRAMELLTNRPFSRPPAY